MPGAAVGMAVAIGTAAAAKMPARTARRERIGVGEILAFDMTLSSCWGLEPRRKFALPLGLLFWYPLFMSKSIKDTTKKRGRPVTTGKGTQVGTRWQDVHLKQIDDWRRKQD